MFVAHAKHAFNPFLLPAQSIPIHAILAGSHHAVGSVWLRQTEPTGFHTMLCVVSAPRLEFREGFFFKRQDFLNAGAL